MYPIRLQSTVQKPLVFNASCGDGAPLCPGGWHETLHTFESLQKSQGLTDVKPQVRHSEARNDFSVFPAQELLGQPHSTAHRARAPRGTHRVPPAGTAGPPSCGTWPGRGMGGAYGASQLRSLMLNET